MRVFLIKSKNETNTFKTFKALGANVLELEDLNKVDSEILSLINKDYNTIVITNEVASFSEDIIKKYQKDKDINIIITPSKNK